MPIPQRPLRYIGGGELTAFLTNQIVQRKPLRGKCYLNMSHYIINGGACQYFCKKNSLLLYEKNSGALRQKTKAASFRGIVALSEVQSAKRSACIRIFFQFLFLRICLKRFPFRVAPVPPPPRYRRCGTCVRVRKRLARLFPSALSPATAAPQSTGAKIIIA